MSATVRDWKQGLAKVTQLKNLGQYAPALAKVEELREVWPGNAHLHVLWASLVQLQENPIAELDDAKKSLQDAVELDKGSPAAALELGHYLDNVEDDPRAAAKVYADGVATARQLLIDGLIGQAKAYQQLDRREDMRRCLEEALRLSDFDGGPKRIGGTKLDADAIFELLAGSG